MKMAVYTRFAYEWHSLRFALLGSHDFHALLITGLPRPLDHRTSTSS
jgi:hypothetical protein